MFRRRNIRPFYPFYARGSLKGDKMRATIEGGGKNAAQSSSLEAEVEAWRKNRALRPVSTTGKCP
jgi:hypothetical protein